jgi:hypothetical protein
MTVDSLPASEPSEASPIAEASGLNSAVGQRGVCLVGLGAACIPAENGAAFGSPTASAAGTPKAVDIEAFDSVLRQWSPPSGSAAPTAWDAEVPSTGGVIDGQSEAEESLDGWWVARFGERPALRKTLAGM